LRIRNQGTGVHGSKVSTAEALLLRQLPFLATSMMTAEATAVPRTAQRVRTLNEAPTNRPIDPAIVAVVAAAA